MNDKLKRVILIIGILVIIAVFGLVLLKLRNLSQAQKAALISVTATIETSPAVTATASQTAIKEITTTATLTATVEPSPTKSDEELIKQAFANKNSSSIDEISVTIKNKSENSAYGQVSFTDEGGWFVAVKQDGNWKIIADGNGVLFCSALEGYDVPSSVVGECYDSATESTIKR